jgi:hypothetical protein
MPQGEVKLIENTHFYIDANGNYVFTELYLTQRGTCCKNGCKHCPYGYKKENHTIVSNIKLILFFIVIWGNVILLSNAAFAQENYFLQSIAVNPYLINPANVCIDTKLEAGVGYRNEEAQLYNNRKSMFAYVAFDVPSIHSTLGAVLLRHQAATFYPIQYSTLALSHSFKIKTSETTTLALSLQCMLHHFESNINNWPYIPPPSTFTPIEPLYRIPFFKADWNIGIAYHTPHWQLGGSVLHPSTPKWLIGGGYPSYQIEREVNLSAIYTLKKFNNQLWVRPSVLLHSKQRQSIANAMLSLGWKGLFFLGFGGNIFNRTFIQYPYDYTLQLTAHLFDKLNFACIYSHVDGRIQNTGFNTTKNSFKNIELQLNYAIKYKK